MSTEDQDAAPQPEDETAEPSADTVSALSPQGAGDDESEGDGVPPDVADAQTARKGFRIAEHWTQPGAPATRTAHTLSQLAAAHKAVYQFASAQKTLEQLTSAHNRMIRDGVLAMADASRQAALASIRHVLPPPIKVSELFGPALSAQRMAPPALALSPTWLSSFNWAGIVGRNVLDDHARVMAAVLPAVSRQVQETARAITQIAEMLLPANLRSFGDDDWAAIIDISAADGIVLAWAPRTEIVHELVQARQDREKRRRIIDERRPDILADIDASISAICHEEVAPLGELLRKAMKAAHDGHIEAALTLIAAVLDRIGTDFARRLEGTYASEMPKADGARKTGTVLLARWKAKPSLGSFRNWQYLEWLIIAGMQHVFARDEDTTPDHYNRHRVAHLRDGALDEAYLVPALLVAQGLLRHWAAIRTAEDNAEAPDDEEEEGSSA